MKKCQSSSGPRYPCGICKHNAGSELEQRAHRRKHGVKILARRRSHNPLSFGYRTKLRRGVETQLDTWASGTTVSKKRIKRNSSSGVTNTAKSKVTSAMADSKKQAGNGGNSDNVRVGSSMPDVIVQLHPIDVSGKRVTYTDPFVLLDRLDISAHTLDYQTGIGSRKEQRCSAQLEKKRSSGEEEQSGSSSKIVKEGDKNKVLPKVVVGSKRKKGRPVKAISSDAYLGETSSHRRGPWLPRRLNLANDTAILKDLNLKVPRVALGKLSPEVINRAWYNPKPTTQPVTSHTSSKPGNSFGEAAAKKEREANINDVVPSRLSGHGVSMENSVPLINSGESVPECAVTAATAKDDKIEHNANAKEEITDVKVESTVANFSRGITTAMEIPTETEKAQELPPPNISTNIDEAGHSKAGSDDSEDGTPAPTNTNAPCAIASPSTASANGSNDDISVQIDVSPVVEKSSEPKESPLPDPTQAPASSSKSDNVNSKEMPEVPPTENSPSSSTCPPPSLPRWCPYLPRPTIDYSLLLAPVPPQPPEPITQPYCRIPYGPRGFLTVPIPHPPPEGCRIHSPGDFPWVPQVPGGTANSQTTSSDGFNFIQDLLKAAEANYLAQSSSASTS